MKAAVVLLLLLVSPFATFSKSDVFSPHTEGVRTRSEVPPALPAIWDELMGLKELVLSLRASEVQQKLTLRSMESRLRDWEEQEETGSTQSLEEAAGEVELRNAEFRKLLMNLTSSLRSTRSKVEELEEQSTGKPQLDPERCCL